MESYALFTIGVRDFSFLDPSRCGVKWLYQYMRFPRSHLPIVVSSHVWADGDLDPMRDGRRQDPIQRS